MELHQALLLAEIKKKKTVNLKDEFILNEIKKILLTDKKAREEIYLREPSKLLKSKEFKSVVKRVRSVLHRSSGQYQGENLGKREKYFEELKKFAKQPKTKRELKNEFKEESELKFDPDLNLDSASDSGLVSYDLLELHKKILSTNKSAKERLDIYPTIYDEIFLITGMPKSILDLGCGINPVSFPFMGFQKSNNLTYYALELSLTDTDFLNKYFQFAKLFGLNGCASAFDLTDLKKNHAALSDFKADVCFIWKVIDPIKLTKSYKLAETLLENVHARWVVVSFSTKTISGKQMNYPKRKWFEVMLERLNYKYELIEKENEIFYVIRKT